jgi:hypothetical protein
MQRGVIVENVVFLYILGNVTPSTTFSECSVTSPKVIQSLRSLCVIVYEQSVSGICWSVNASKVP